MVKSKTSKRERKFKATGGVKGRLADGGTMHSKGKARSRKRPNTAAHDVEAKNKRRKEAEHQKFVSEKEALRVAEDFVGKDNLHSTLGGMDVGSFFAHLEDDLLQPGDDDSDDSSSDDDDDDDSEVEEKAPKKKKKQGKKQPKKAVKKEESGDSESESEDAKGKASRKAKEESDSDSDSEDIEAAEARMKAELKKLQSDDPEFVEFLQENDGQDLLEYGEKEEDDDDVEFDDDMEDEERMTEDEEKEGAKTKKKSIELTPAVLQKLEHGAFKVHGMKSLKKIVRAYKSACHVASSSGEDAEEGASKESKNANEATYHIENSEVFDALMVSCLGQCHEAFRYHLLATEEERDTLDGVDKKDKETSKGVISKKDKKKVKKQVDSDSDSDDDNSSEDEETEDAEYEPEEDTDDTPIDPKVLEKASRWTDMKSILSTFFKSTLHLITESKEPDLLAVVLKAMSKYMRYMTPFPRIAEAFLKTLTELWSAPLGDASADYQVVRLNAFLRIRQLALTQPFPFNELCLKKTYLAYTRRAKFGGTSASIMTNALPTLTFMGNCLVELYSLDHHSSYQHAFIYIRQLALFLRTAMQKKTPEAFQQVYCWQFMHCLKLWVAILSAACKQSHEGDDSGGGGDDQLMQSLVYPLTEIILGTVRMTPAPSRHVPLRFHCIRLLQQLAASSEMYIPTSAILLETLDLKELNMKSKKIKSKGGGDTTRGIQLPFLLKLSKDDPLRTAEEQEACMVEIFKLLNREIDLYRYSAGFPEFSMQVMQRLKKVSVSVALACLH